MVPFPIGRSCLTLFDAVVDLPTIEQRAQLDRIADADPELREEVLRLLEAHRRPNGILDEPVARLADAARAAARQPTADTTPGHVGPWRIVRPIGRGGMATVYLAEDSRHARTIAVKVFDPEQAATLGRERFQREIRLAAQLQHPHILPIYDSGADGDVLWFTMPFVEGETLRQRLQQTGALPIRDAVYIVGCVARALGYAHRRGVVHRDVKPENVLIGTESVFLADFGIAKPVDAAAAPSLTLGGLVIGTPAYMAPEQAAADPATDHRADIYALGVLAYEVLAGQPPFAELPLGLLLAAHASREPEPLTRRRPDVPAALAALIARCLRKDPVERWASADAIHSALQEIALPASPRPEAAGGGREPERPVASWTSLETARAAYDRTEWRTAYDAFREADATEALAAEDQERLAEAAWWIADGTASLRARERAYRQYLGAGQLRAAAMAALALAEDHFHRRARSVGQGWLRRAGRHLDRLPTAAEHGWFHRLNFVVAMDVEGNPGEAMQSADRALAIARQFDDTDLEALALQDRGRSLVALGKVKEGMALMDEAMTAATAGELSPRTTGRAYCNMLSVCGQIGDVGRAAEWYDAASRWSEPYPGSGYPGICRVHRAGMLRLRGSFREAENEARRATEELADFLADVAGEAFYELGEIRLRIGDLAGAGDMFGEAHSRGRNPQPGLARLRLAEGRPDVARALIEQEMIEPGRSRLDQARLLPALIEIRVACGDLAAAEAAVDELEAIATAYASPAFVGAAAVARGTVLLERGMAEEAVLHLRRACRIWTEIDLPFELVQSRLLLGRAYDRLGNTEQAELEARAARTAQDRIDARSLAGHPQSAGPEAA